MEHSQRLSPPTAAWKLPRLRKEGAGPGTPANRADTDIVDRKDDQFDVFGRQVSLGIHVFPKHVLRGSY